MIVIVTPLPPQCTHWGTLPKGEGIAACGRRDGKTVPYEASLSIGLTMDKLHRSGFTTRAKNS